MTHLSSDYALAPGDQPPPYTEQGVSYPPPPVGQVGFGGYPPPVVGQPGFGGYPPPAAGQPAVGFAGYPPHPNPQQPYAPQPYPPPNQYGGQVPSQPIVGQPTAGILVDLASMKMILHPS